MVKTDSAENLDCTLDDFIKKNKPKKKKKTPKKTIKKKGKNSVGKGNKSAASGGPVQRAHQLLKCYVNQPNQEKTQKELKCLRHIVDLLDNVIKKKKGKTGGISGSLFPPPSTTIIRKKTKKKAPKN